MDADVQSLVLLHHGILIMVGGEKFVEITYSLEFNNRTSHEET